MAKRRRPPPKPQARATGRELWEQQQASIKRLTESPFFRSLQDANRRLRESPLGRSLLEDARRLREAPAPTPSIKRRRKGGGRPRKLTPEEIPRLQAIYKAAYRAEPKRKQHDVFDDLCKALGRDVSNTTLRVHVVIPLRQNKPSVISARRNKPPR